MILDDFGSSGSNLFQSQPLGGIRNPLIRFSYPFLGTRSAGSPCADERHLTCDDQAGRPWFHLLGSWGSPVDLHKVRGLIQTAHLHIWHRTRNEVFVYGSSLCGIAWGVEERNPLPWFKIFKTFFLKESSGAVCTLAASKVYRSIKRFLQGWILRIQSASCNPCFLAQHDCKHTSKHARHHQENHGFQVLLAPSIPTRQKHSNSPVGFVFHSCCQDFQAATELSYKSHLPWASKQRH